MEKGGDGIWARGGRRVAVVWRWCDGGVVVVDECVWVGVSVWVGWGVGVWVCWCVGVWACERVGLCVWVCGWVVVVVVVVVDIGWVVVGRLVRLQRRGEEQCWVLNGFGSGVDVFGVGGAG